VLHLQLLEQFGGRISFCFSQRTSLTFRSLLFLDSYPRREDVFFPGAAVVSGKNVKLFLNMFLQCAFWIWVKAEKFFDIQMFGKVLF